MADAMCLKWWKQSLADRKHIPCPIPPPNILILVLKSRSFGNHGTPERTELDNGTHFQNNQMTAWANEYSIEWVCHISCHAPASGKIEQYNELFKTTLRTVDPGTLKHWDTQLVKTQGSANGAGHAKSKPLYTIEGDKVLVVHIRNVLSKTGWVTLALGKGMPIHGNCFCSRT